MVGMNILPEKPLSDAGFDSKADSAAFKLPVDGPQLLPIPAHQATSVSPEIESGAEINLKADGPDWIAWGPDPWDLPAQVPARYIAESILEQSADHDCTRLMELIIKAANEAFKVPVSMVEARSFTAEYNVEPGNGSK